MKGFVLPILFGLFGHRANGVAIDIRVAPIWVFVDIRVAPIWVFVLQLLVACDVANSSPQRARFPRLYLLNLDAAMRSLHRCNGHVE